MLACDMSMLSWWVVLLCNGAQVNGKTSVNSSATFVKAVVLKRRKTIGISMKSAAVLTPYPRQIFGVSER